MGKFSDRFIESLPDPLEKKRVQAFNDIAVSDSTFEPKGLFGCLFAVNTVLSSGRSLAFEEALFRGAVQPLFILFKDLEEYGDLNENSIKKLREAKQRLMASEKRYRLIAPNNKEAELQYVNDIFSKATVDELRKKQNILNSLAEAEKEYEQHKEKKSSERIEQLKHGLEQIEIGIEILEEMMKPHKEKYISALENEDTVLKEYFGSFAKELEYIEGCVKAIQRKNEINQEYPINSTKEKIIEKRQKALEKLQEEIQEYRYLISDFTLSKERVERLGGKLLIPTSQGKLAAMGHSDGLCAGFSVEFLMICSEPGWNDLPLDYKLKKLSPLFQGEQNFTLSNPFDPSKNKLSMTLRSGMFWDSQSAIRAHSAVFSVQQKDCRDNDAFYEKMLAELVKDLKKHNFDEKPRNHFIVIQGAESAHALALSCDKNGEFLFQDSNTGYISCKDEASFSTFFVNYLKANYPDLNEVCFFFDFDTMKKTYDASRHIEFQNFLEHEQKYEQSLQAEEEKAKRAGQLYHMGQPLQVKMQEERKSMLHAMGQARPMSKLEGKKEEKEKPSSPSVKRKKK